MRADEFIAGRKKAGLIPFYTDSDGQVLMLFMVPSNPAYGGTQPQIAKGGVDEGESVQIAAIREAQEELGMAKKNLRNIRQVLTTVIEDNYIMSLFIAEVKNPNKVGKTDFETGKRYWLTIHEFEKYGRDDQVRLVQHAHQFMRSAQRSAPVERGQVS